MSNLAIESLFDKLIWKRMCLLFAIIKVHCFLFVCNKSILYTYFYVFNFNKISNKKIYDTNDFLKSLFVIYC